MTTDSLTAVHNGNGSPNGTAIRTATVLDGANVHRDWRHLATEATGIVTALTAGGALYAATFHATAALTWALAVGCAVSAVALVVLLTLMLREGRRWTYATDTDTDPA